MIVSLAMYLKQSLNSHTIHLFKVPVKHFRDIIINCGLTMSTNRLYNENIYSLNLMEKAKPPQEPR